ncbi:helix-turn-helix domain-containing protein [Tenacibaculum aiptasiae]|uniref:helix-turn-helix domain-containing protein n=1 Tax=Tenacibaculum aiptasiae TaxID=426481 RepID=UPI00232B8BBE|nr:helix-turn-helix transcriptional regulator [Tenacibaculum aiptasiae]
MDENIKIITENIRLERLRKGLSQDKMANLLQISQNAYSKIESGKTTLTIIRLYQIAKVLEIPFEKLFLG